MECDEPGWQDLEAAWAEKRLPERPGIYLISRQRPVDRIGGTDPRGVLHVGHTSNLRRRLNLFMGAASGGAHEHSGGRNYHRWGYHLTLAPRGELRVKWELAENPEDAEGRALDAYVETYGELPPLNGQGS
jgi:hypothetical protein